LKKENGREFVINYSAGAFEPFFPEKSVMTEEEYAAIRAEYVGVLSDVVDGDDRG
jgi:hypothetical protein